MQHVFLFGFIISFKRCIIESGYLKFDKMTSHMKQEFEASEIAAHSHSLTSQQASVHSATAIAAKNASFPLRNNSF